MFNTALEPRDSRFKTPLQGWAGTGFYSRLLREKEFRELGADLQTQAPVKCPWVYQPHSRTGSVPSQNKVNGIL